MKKLILFIVTSILICLFSIAAMSQATTGSLRVTVVDSTGGVIANANIKVKNEATGVESSAVTNSEGIFSFPSLQPGSYIVTTETTGFKRSVKTNIQVRLGIVNTVDVILEAGNITETVSVVANSDETLQTAQSQISTTFDNKKIEDLPSNGAGGGIDTLALLAPGVVPNRVGGTNTNGAGFSVNGNRGRSNNFQIDGADNNDLSIGGPALFVVNPEALQEFQIVTNNFDARSGRNQGAVINLVTKGGTNQFHGSGFWHHQNNRALNSLTNIQRRSGITEKDPFLWNVFGGTFGGPVYLPAFGEGGPMIWKGTERAFFFVSYQGIRNPSKTPGRATNLGILPTEFARLQATFPNNPVINAITKYSPWAIPGTALNAVTSASTPVVNSAFINPSTGQPFLTGGAYDIVNLGTADNPLRFQAAQYERTVDTSYNQNDVTFRFDVRATQKDNVSFRYLYQKAIFANAAGAVANGWLGDVPFGSTNYGGNWTRNITNSLFNDIRLNYQRINTEFGGGCEAGAIGCIPGPDKIGDSFTNIAFAGSLGLTKTNALAGIGPGAGFPQGRIGKVYQFVDNLSWITGKHSLTFGYEYKYLDTIVPFLPNFNGAYTYNSAARIVNNAPNAVAITLGDPTLAFKEKDHYVFVQDDFKIRSNLTLNLGVRYEYTGQPINILNEVATIRESNAATALYNTSLPIDQRVPPRIPADTNNIAPRVGFAYTPNFEGSFLRGLFGNNQTVFRGGFSIAYDAAFYNILLNVMGGAPFSAALNIPTSSLPATGSNAGVPNDPFGSVVRANALAKGILPRGVLNPIYLAQTKVAPDFKAPYSEQFSFGMQRQFGTKHIAEVRWVATHGVGLFQNINDNFFVGPLVNGFTRNITLTNGTTQSVVFPGFSNLLPAGTVAQVCTDVAGTLDNEGSCNNRQYRTGGVTTRRNSSQSIYHSMQARYNGRLLKDSLSLGLAYTWSKTIDDSSEIFAFGDIASPSAQNPFCINRCERSISNLDRPHAFSMNFTYAVPFMKEQRGFAGKVLGGWQLNSTYIITSGSAYTPNNNVGGSFGLGNTYLTAGDRPFVGNPNVDEKLVGISQIDANLLFGIPVANQNGFWSMNELNSTGNSVAVTPNDVRLIINGPGAAKYFGTPFGTMPRNYLRGPIFNQMNLGLFKTIRVMENLRIQLRGEAFNVLNHPNPGIGVNAGGNIPTLNLTNAGVEGNAFGNNKDIELGNRVVQVGLRIVF